jgi:poly-beta-1,6-N-acetyl-D-glucosamine synthase
MIKWIIWAVSFASLYVGTFWLQVHYLKGEKKERTKRFPSVSIIVPAWNEEAGIWKTVHSIVNLKYPREKLEVLIVDHGSTDKTAEVAKKLIKAYPEYNIKLIHKARAKGHVKAHATNEGLKYAKGELIACVDADSVVMEDSVLLMVDYFEEENVGAVISTIKVSQPKNIYEKIQHLEYIFATFTRSLMSKADTLHISQGALSIYKKNLLLKYGGFDEKNITEDLEIAMRLKYYGHRILLCKESISYTRVPGTFKALWDQRVRWFRGFMYNAVKFRKMAFSKKHGMMGMFQYPLNVFSVVTILLMFVLMSYTFFTTIIKKYLYYSSINWDIFYFNLPNIKNIILSTNVTILFPIAISLGVALFIYHQAHKNLKEKWQYPVALLTYLTIFPLLRGMHWMTAFYKESIRGRNKW